MTGDIGQDPRYGAPRGRDRRSWDSLGWAVAGILMIVVAVLTGALLVLLLGRGDGGATASISPTTSLPAAATASAGREPTPPDLGASPMASGPPPTSVRPEPTPVTQLTRLRLLAIGLEDPASPGAVDRVIAFTSGVAGEARIEAAGISVGEVEVCVQPGGREPSCQAGEEVVFDAIPVASGWEVVLRGATEGVAATVDLDVRFPANAATVELTGFRLSGVSGGANGLTLVLAALGAGPLGFEATWPTPADWLLTVTDGYEAAAPFEASGDATSTSAIATTELAAERRYRLEFTSPTGTEEIHFDATVSLP